jgi:predicted acyl esterase
MRRNWLVATMLGVVLMASLLATAAPAAQTSFSTVKETLSVKTRVGYIYLEITHPVDAKGEYVKSPAILTYSPYSALGRGGPAGWAPQGYTGIYADVVGTGNSGGCYDYGGDREKKSVYDIVEWIAKQKWSTGKVGMIGGSYDGTTTIAAASMRPPHLTTIIPEAAISRWYEYAYSGGIRYSVNNEKLGGEGPTNGVIIDEQGFDTPLGFDFGFAMPPPTDVQDPNWAEKVQSTVVPCDELEHTQNGYDMDTPTYNKFWLERDYITNADKITIPVLIGANWGDWNVKQEESWNLYKALTNSPKAVLYMGTRWDSHGVPGGDYSKTVQAWFDHYLKGVDNGVEDMPNVVSQTSDHAGPGEFISGTPKVKDVTLIAQETPKTDPNDYQWKLLPMKPMITGPEASVASFPSTGINTESHAAHHAINNHDWWYFQSPPLKKDIRIFGTIKVKIYSHTDREWVTYTPSIFDVDPADHTMVQGQHVATDPKALVGVTRGWLATATGSTKRFLCREATSPSTSRSSPSLRTTSSARAT